MRQPALPPGEQVEPGCQHRVRRGVQPQPLRQHHPQDHARLGIMRQRLLGRAVDQRVEIDQPAQDFAGNGPRQRLVLELADVAGRAVEGDVERFALAKHCIEQAQRSAAGVDTGRLGHGGQPLPPLAQSRQRHHVGGMPKRATTRPEGFKKPAHWTNDAPPAPRKGSDDEDLSPTRYGDWVKDGIAIDF